MSPGLQSGIGNPGAVAVSGFAAVALLLVLQLLPVTPAAARPPGPTASAAFSVRASNGFLLDVGSEAGTVVVAASERRPPIASFSPGGRPRPADDGNGAASIYYARATGADPTRVVARLGGLGGIAVRFHPSGRTRVTELGASADACAPARIVRRLGTFTGTIRFRGEDGYTEVEADSAPGSVGTPLPAGCAGGGAARTSGLARRAPWPDPDSAVLGAVNARAGTSFQATTSATGVAFLAIRKERLAGGVVVSRRAYAGAPPSTFTFDRALTSARVKPPAPFSGIGRYLTRPGGGASWSGNLRATFPGVNLPMTGPGFRPSLGPGR